MSMRVRPSARGVVFDAAGAIMLLRCEDSEPVDPRNPDILRYWVTPGGGTKNGETAVESLERELFEETGVTDVEIGPCVWTRDLEFVIHGRRIMSNERYFVCTATSTATSLDYRTTSERDIIKEIRWWTFDELAVSEEIFRPPGFVGLARSLFTDGPPAEPVRLTE